MQSLHCYTLPTWLVDARQAMDGSKAPPRKCEIRGDEVQTESFRSMIGNVSFTVSLDVERELVDEVNRTVFLEW